MRPLPQYGLAEQSALVQPVPTLGGAPGLRRILRQIAFVTSRSLKSTDVFGRRITLEDLIARILRDLREKAEAQFGAKIRTAVAGRPGVLRRR
jgi:hypothetical protein